MSVFFLIQEALPYLKKQNNSSIVIIASYAGYDLSPNVGHYAITKTALIALTKVIAK
jgi:NAD(P)-dependent dehydrogenase (short-subunit alcohol dehydrogenase family)